MRIVTVITDLNNPGYKSLLRPSVLHNDFTMDTLETSYYKSHRSKDQVLVEYLRTIDKDEVIMFTDGYDTMLLAGEDEILRKFNHAKKQMVFAGEIVCWPDSGLADAYPASVSPFRFLNSGGFIGKAGYIYERIYENLKTKSIEKYYWSNQIYWTEQFLRHSDEIGIDAHCDIFCTMVSKEDINIGKEFLKNVDKLRRDKSFNDLKEITDFHIANSSQKGNFDREEYYLLKKAWFQNSFTIENGRLFIKKTQTHPCHLHFNGGSDILIADILSALSFEPSLKRGLEVAYVEGKTKLSVGASYL